MSIKTAIASIIVALGILAAVAFGFLHSRTSAPDAEPTAPPAPATVTDVPLPPVETGTMAASFRFEIANTPALREQGLSGRAEVPSGYGMLFVFDQPGSYGFWMKDMLVPIDMIWLSDDGTILGIDEAVSPATYPTPFHPPQPVRLVLETKAGEARAQGWGIGTRIPLPL